MTRKRGQAPATEWSVTDGHVTVGTVRLRGAQYIAIGLDDREIGSARSLLLAARMLPRIIAKPPRRRAA